MSCPSLTYAGTRQVNSFWTNWSGRVAGPVTQFFVPSNLPDLVNIVQSGSETDHQIRVVGSGWSFENVAYSPDWMISTNQLNRTVGGVIDTALNEKWSALQLTNGDMSLFHVEAGIEIAHLNNLLDQAGLALETLGGANGQTLAGAISTGTHGGDIFFPPLSDAVMAMHIVTVDGRELWIERASDPITDDAPLALALACADAEIVRDDALFDAMLVCFGRFGIVYSYVLRVTQAFKLAEWTVKISRRLLIDQLRSGVSLGTFLRPLLDVLPDPPATLGALDIKNPRSLEVAFDTSNLDMCWVKRRWKTEGADLHIEATTDALCDIGAGGVLAAAQGVLEAAKAVVLLIPVVGLVQAALITSKQVWLATSYANNPAMTAGEMLALSLQAMWDSGPGIGGIPDFVANHLFNARYKDSAGEGKRGPSHLIISGHRASSQQDCYRADSIEPIFDAWNSGYLNFLDSVVANMPQKQAGYVSLRWSSISKATLSMHHFESQNAVAIEITSLKGLPDNAAWMRTVELLSIKNGGRPHWGQINNFADILVSMTYDEVLSKLSTMMQEGRITPFEGNDLLLTHNAMALYGKPLLTWRSSLADLVGHGATFSNAFTLQRGLEPTTVLQSDWRWCDKCQGLHFGPGVANSKCPAGGTHSSGSSNYTLMHDAAAHSGRQSNWRWCSKCQGLHYGLGVASSRCPAGGIHATDSWDYTLRYYMAITTGRQRDWHWCVKCQGLHFDPNVAGSRCAAGGTHESSGGNSANYSLLITP